ncbi:MAG: hypothetical protein JKY48_13480 [Flavobacteriales bacterium]|nr:hypothetical protein [Flavobacteriales bacterium]
MSNRKIRFIFSLVFIICYFVLLGAILAVEVSDSVNMEQGENTMMGELNILLGLLTAGLGQIINYWFSNKKAKGNTTPAQ